MPTPAHPEYLIESEDVWIPVSFQNSLGLPFFGCAHERKATAWSRLIGALDDTRKTVKDATGQDFFSDALKGNRAATLQALRRNGFRLVRGKITLES